MALVTRALHRTGFARFLAEFRAGLEEARETKRHPAVRSRERTLTFAQPLGL